MKGVAAALALAAAAASAPSAAEESWDQVARVVAVGDVHGDYAQLVAVLEQAGLVGKGGRWAGGRTHLVQTGDRVDRGSESRKVMDLLRRLEKEARAAGGRVHPLIGNHEAMNVLGDLRYVTTAEFAEFAPAGAAGDAAHPPGWAEHRRAWAPRGTYGGWVARQNAVIRIGDTLFLHGGLAPRYADFSLRDLNQRIRRELEEADPLTALVSSDPEGPLWFRGLAEEPERLSAHVDAVLKRHGVRRMVIGHTVTGGVVLPRYGGRVVMIDVGLAGVYGGPPASLLLEDGRAFAVHRGQRLPLPEAGQPLAPYVRAAMALEPDPARLRGLLEKLEAAPLSVAPR
jgi:hypothetical protein